MIKPVLQMLEGNAHPKARQRLLRKAGTSFEAPFKKHKKQCWVTWAGLEAAYTVKLAA